MNFRVGLFLALVYGFHCCLHPFRLVSLAEAAPLALEQRIKNELNEPMSTLTESTLEEIRSHHHVLIPGMMNGVADFLGLYYVEVKSFLTSIGAEFTYHGLPTKTSALVNAGVLNLKLRTIYESQIIKKPISIRGHSKGGAEVLLTVLRNSDLILDGIVDKVLLEQAAARGSSLAAPRIFSFLNPFSYFYLSEGLQSVHTSEAQKNLDEAFEVFEESLKDRFKREVAVLSRDHVLGSFGASASDLFKREEKKFVDQKRLEISSKIRYLRTYQEPDQFSLGTRIVLWACNQTLDRQAGPSDGLVLLDDQKDDRIGSDLGILKLDHVALSISLLSHTSAEERMAMVRAVLGLFYEKSQ